MSSEKVSNEFLERIQKLSPKKLVLLAAELERRLAARDTLSPAHIAVVGIGCRMPGGADTPEAFWNLLANKVDAIEDIPITRWNVDAFYDARLGIPGKMNTKSGGFTRNVDLFDSAFFGISPREAVGLDPQQRMLLEVSWEALENACIRPDSLNGSPTGVFVGMSTNDYASLLTAYDDRLFDAYSGTGIARSVAAGRLSYFLGLKGPNVTIDTACSSSAVAIHLACQSLRQNECRQAIAGGVNSILLPQLTVTLAQAQMLASDGRCKTFSKSADGFVRSEGCGLIILKRLADAQADGDNILGVILASATNHDGRSSGLTAPNGPSQEAVIATSLAQAGIRPEDVDYIETHGTGTVLGDAIELGALASVFRKRTSSPLFIGSVKTNIGHMEAAAGVASVIKVLLSLTRNTIPAHLHFTEENKNAALSDAPLHVPVNATPWISTHRPRIAGVSSFGFSGTNAHLIIQEAPPSKATTSIDKPQIITVSAKTSKALSELCARYASYLRDHQDTLLNDFAFSVNTGRSHFQHRIAVLSNNLQDAAAQLEQIATSDIERHTAYRFIAGYEEPSIGFLFTGQGAQYPAMGRSLYTQNTVFRDAIDRCDAVLVGKLTYPLAAILLGISDVPDDLIHDTAWTQPVLFAFEYGLAMMWMSWGVRPSIVLGHSLGEYVAACIAGVYTLEDALTLAYVRGRLMGGLPRGGAMLAARIGEADISELLRSFHKLSIAAVNGSLSTVISGNIEEIEQVRMILADRGITSQQLSVSHAFHSELMEPILDLFEDHAETLTPHDPRISLISNVTGQVSVSASHINASYWRRHLRGTVRFADGLAAMLEKRPVALLEIGPDAVLLGMSRPVLAQCTIPGIPSLLRTKDTWQTVSEALRQLYLAGAPIQWSEAYHDRPSRKTALPTYPFQRQRYWVAIPQKESLATSIQSSKEIQDLPKSFDPLLYCTEWQTQIITARADCSLHPDELIHSAVNHLKVAIEDPSLGKVLASFAQFKPQLDHLCALYIVETLADLGLDLRSCNEFISPDLPTKLAVSAEHRRLFDRMMNILEEDRIICCEGAGWIVTSAPADSANEFHLSLEAKFPWFMGELNFVRRARYLPVVLRGEMPAVEALFPGGSFDLAERVYQDAPAAHMFNRAVAEVVKKAIDSYSSDDPIKIIEIGAGTGSTSSCILPLLHKKNVEYWFTDISSSFLAKARVKFAEFPFVSYGVLDIEKGLYSEALTAGLADIVIAANVLHATSDLRQTIAHVKQILRPGGTLVLLEGIAKQRFGDLTVGMTDGWWRYTDAHFRDNYPLIKQEKWLQLLSDAGFDCKALPKEGAAAYLVGQQTIVIASCRSGQQHEDAKELLLFEHPGSKLAASLQSTGVKTQVISKSSQAEALGQEIKHGCYFRHIVYELPAAGNWDVPELAIQNAISVLALFQDVAKSDVDKPEIWLVSRSSSDTVGASQNIAARVVDGMAKTMRLEYPALSVRRIDLPAVPSDQDMHLFAQLIRTGTHEHDLEIFDGHLHVARLTQLSSTSTPTCLNLKISANGAYLITGAFGGLGLHTAQWMASRGAGVLYMIGRHAPSSAVRAQLASITNYGTKIHELVVDVSQQDSVSELMERIYHDDIPLQGVIHAAGIVDDGTLFQQTPARVASVFAAKVYGGWYLHEATKGLSLDFFVLYGSAASVLGSAGQMNHAAANSFLDALANLRRNMGLQATTIAWGAWAEIGAATRIKDTGRSTRFGLKWVTPEKGIELLEQTICGERANVAALPVDWEIYLSHNQSSSTWPYFARLISQKPLDFVNSQKHDLTKSINKAAPSDRLNLIKAYLRGRVTDVLRLDKSFTLLEEQPLSELGLDSLMALELKNELQSAMSITLPPNFFFEYSTLKLASTYLDARLVVSGPATDFSEHEELTI